MPITAIAALVLGLSDPLPPLYCPATLEKITGAPALTVEYGGIIFGTCCAGCGNSLLKDPKPLLVEAVRMKKTVGTFEFDPISGARIDPEKSAAYSDYKAVRYLFTSKDEKKAFDAQPSGFITDVKSAAYVCPVSKEAIAPTKGGGYLDYKGTRYFTCCTDCLKKLKADPTKYVANSASAIKPLVAVPIK